MTFQYTEDNYFQWGFQTGKPFSLVPERAADVGLWYDIVDRANLVSADQFSYRKQAINAARKIASKADKPITLFVSGGIDSEAMVLAFMLAGIRFDCTILAYEYGINHHEVEVARALCEHWRLDHSFVRVDPFRLWYNPPEFVHRHRMESGILIGMMEALTHRWDRFQVCGGNPVIKTTKWAPHGVTMEVRKAVLCHMLMWIERDHPGVSLFHMYTPEQLSCWLNSPLIQAWEKQVRGSQVFDFDSIKTLFYQMEFPEIQFSRPKWTGEEFVRNHISDLYQNQWAGNRPFNPVFRRPLSEVRSLLGL